ncbi:hypothetical protein SAMN05660429_01968 [Thalassotalea agarivorans]|uniref:Uncharacterized protein n=1 Tax=Thalassotalea agarivorans TaxID=349064 RepID=A0A1I0EWK1_THASX|nr:hypothetical protein SAMN05660429_01968 [Thalassotalea agarivorans]
MNTKVKESLKSTKYYIPWFLSAIAIIVFFKVALSPEEIELIVLLKRVTISILIVVPASFIFLFLVFYFDLVDVKKNSE